MGGARVLGGLILLAALLGAAVPAAATAQAPAPISPAPGEPIAWENAYASGVPLVVHAPPGLYGVSVQIGSPLIDDYADTAYLAETSPGVYRGEALTFLSDEEGDPGLYTWRASYDPPYDPSSYRFPDTIYGPESSFTIRPPYRAPRISLALRSRQLTGRRYRLDLNYARGSDQADHRVHVSYVRGRRSCPETPNAARQVPIISGADPGEAGLITSVRPRSLGRLRYCAFLVADGNVLARVSRAVSVAQAPVPKRRMLRWGLSRDGIGPLKVGMQVRRIERVTGRTMVFGYGFSRACSLWSLRGAPRGLSIMVAYGRVVRFHAWRGRWHSSRGIRIGSSEAAVRRRYGRVTSHRHPYTTGKYLNVGGPQRRMTFETDAGGRVTSFRGGRTKQVRYIEGCA